MAQSQRDAGIFPHIQKMQSQNVRQLKPLKSVPGFGRGLGVPGRQFRAFTSIRWSEWLS